MTLQMCQFAFYTLAFASAAISLTLMYMGVVYILSVSLLGLSVSALGLICQHRLPLSRPEDARAGAHALHRPIDRSWRWCFPAA